MIFTELPPIHHLPSPTPSYHYAESPLGAHTSRPMSKSDPKPIFSFSPVSDANANAATAPTSSTTPFTSSRETNPSTTTTSSSSRSKSAATYAHRYQTTLTNPVSNTPQSRTSTSPHARNNRRTAFLNRVKADRDEGRFENRADQFMRLEHDAERRVWGQEMERTAEGIMRGMDVDGYDYESEEGVGGDDERVLDELISQEDAEAMEMGLPEEKNQDHGHEHGQGLGLGQGQTRIAEFGSFSDDEYDHLFMDLAGQQGQGMDMSSG